MATRTINARTDLTYEEIYDGHANGKSRLPKILKDIVEDRDPFASLAEGSGIDIKRRRTSGGNSQNASNVGVTVTDSDIVAKLISWTRFNSLLSNYDGINPVYNTPPSQNFTDIDVRGLIKEPFDLLDQVSGVNRAYQTKNAGDGLVGRAAKLKEDGSRSSVRDITQIIVSDTQNFNVREFNNDRIGSGGITGEVHGVDVGIQDLVDVKSEALVIGNTGESFDFSSDEELAADIDNQGGATAEFGDGTLSVERTLLQGNAQFDLDRSKRSALYQRFSQVALRSQDLGGEVDITDGNTPLGLGATVVVGATVGSASIAATGQEVINLGAASVDRLTNIRYGTFQFGTVRVFNSINDSNPVAVVVHPDLLADLIRNQP